MATPWRAAYVPPQGSIHGQVLFLRDQTLLAQQFDPKRLEPIGEPIPVAEQLGYYRNGPFYAASTNGTLIYGTGSSTPIAEVQKFM